MNTQYKLFTLIGLIVLLGGIVFIVLASKMPKNADFSEVTPPVSYVPPPAPPKEVLTQNKIQTFNLSVGEKAEFQTGEITLMDVLADSRCPKEVQCIRAGEVKIGLKYRNNSTLISQDVTLQYPGGSVIVDNYKMEIVSVTPEKTINPIDKKTYRFQITVEQVGGSKTTPADTSSGKGFGTLSGSVLIGPMCPVMREGVACPDRGAPDIVLLVTNVKSGLSYTVTTDSFGAFSLTVEAGTYSVKNGSTKPYPMISPIEVVVKAGVVTSVVMHGDSGIR